MRKSLLAVIGTIIILAGVIIPFGKAGRAQASFTDEFNLQEIIGTTGLYSVAGGSLVSNGSDETSVTVNAVVNYKTPPNDDNNDTKFDKGDTFGSWDEILDTTRVANSATEGIFIIVGTGVKAAQSNTQIVTGQLTYGIESTGGITAQTTTANILGNSTKAANIGGFIWGVSPTANGFFDKSKRQVTSGNIHITGLTADTTYYAQVYLIEDTTFGSPDYAYGPVLVLKTNAAGETNATVDPKDLPAQPPANEGSSGVYSKFTDLLTCNPFKSITEMNPNFTGGGCVTGIFGSVFVSVSHWLAETAGKLFDAFAGVSLGSKIYGGANGGAQIGSFIESSWGIVRDISNIFFIFILLYTALGLVVSLHHFDAKKLIMNVIIMALFINFSLFFCRVSIDASNILSRVFYNAMDISTKGNPPTVTGGEVKEQAISAAIIGGVQPQKLLSQESYDLLSKTAQGGTIGAGTIFVVFLFSFILNLAFAWLFFMCAAFFAGRIGVIWFSMIFAPLAFVTYIVPSLQGPLKQLGWTQWLSTFMSACFKAPVFFFFMYLIVNLTGGSASNPGILGTIMGAVSGDAGWVGFIVGIMLPAMILLGLLREAKSIAESMAGEFGGAFAGIVAAGAGMIAMGATGGAAIAGRSVIGAAAQRISSPQSSFGNKMRDFASTNKFGSGFARLGVRSTEAAKKSSFDLRNTGIANGLSKATGVDMNIGAKIPLAGMALQSLSTENTAGGFEGKMMRQAEKDRKFADSLGMDKNKDAAIGGTIREREKDISKQEDTVDELKGLVQAAKASGGTLATYTDPVTGTTLTNVSQADIQDSLNHETTRLRTLKKGGDKNNPAHVWSAADAANPNTKKADGTKVTTADVGQLKTNFIGLEALKKAQETNKRARANEYYNGRLLKSSGDFDHANGGHSEERDALGNITKLAHGNGKVAMKGFLKNLGKDFAAGAAAGAVGGGLVAGPVGAALGAAGFGAARALRNLVLEESVGNFRYETAHLASDASHAIHRGQSSYKSPTSGFTDMFKGSGGGGGHAAPAGGHGGGHDDHGGGHH